jgi:hypothetical protein
MSSSPSKTSAEIAKEYGAKRIGAGTSSVLISGRSGELRTASTSCSNWEFSDFTFITVFVTGVTIGMQRRLRCFPSFWV